LHRANTRLAIGGDGGETDSGMRRRGPQIQVIGVKAPLGCRAECDRQGRLIVRLIDSEDDPTLREFGSPEIAADLGCAFKLAYAHGLSHLVLKHLGSRLPAGLSFLREFSLAMHNHWVLAYRSSGAFPGGPPDGVVDAWAALGRDVPGLETLSPGDLRDHWRGMVKCMRDTLIPNKMSIVDYLMQYDDWWENVGAPILFLAESAEEAERPFSLTSGFINGMNAVRANVIVTPLSVPILGESRVPELGRHLYGIMRQAAQRSAVLRRLLDSQAIYRPCLLIPRDAHAFLGDVSLIEEAGIRVSLPRGWRAMRPAALKARTSVGVGAPTSIGGQPLLDLKTAFVVDEEELTESEYRRVVRESVNGLVRIRERWVMVDQARITAAHQRWRKTEELRGRGGVSYREALDLTEKTRAAACADEVQGGDLAEEFVVGSWLRDALSAIQRHDLRREFSPGVHMRGQLRGYQRQGVAWLSLLAEVGAGACLADDMGLGKSYQVIALLVALKARGAEGPHLVVAPASLLVNWREEFTKWSPTLGVRIVHGSTEGDDADQSDVVLTSYGTLMKRPAIQERPWGIAVLDEAQVIKNPKAKLTRVVKRLRARARICLTGTPVENHLDDLWSIMDFLNPGLLGGHEHFREWCRTMLKGEDRLAPLRRLVRPFILRRLKTDPDIAPELPPKVEVPVYCGLTAIQADLYAAAYNSIRVRLAASEGLARHGLAFTLLTRLKQVCNHPAQYLEDRDYDPYSSGKFVVLTHLARTIAERGEKALVFTQYQEITAPLAAHLERAFGRPGLVLDGTTPVRRRQEIVADFQREVGPPFVVMTYKVGGTGFNLTAACNVIHFDRWYNPAVENQASDRAYRIGQTKGVVVHKFICRGTLEERIEQLLQHKKAIAADALGSDDDEGPVRIGELSPDEILTLAALDPARAAEGATPPPPEGRRGG
jgi:hypothetical protein